MKNIKNILFEFIKEQDIDLEYDVFSYGFSIVTTYALFLIVLIPISIINHTFIETIIFIITFTSLRQNLGGLHFDNPLICFVVSLMIAIAIPLISHHSQSSNLLFILIIFLLSFINFNSIGTIDHENKRLDNNEKGKFKAKANKILLFYFIMIIMFYPYIPVNYKNTVLFTILLLNFNLIFPFILNLI